jgi:glycosyltransferase involved in cell wall biosynthesis
MKNDLTVVVPCYNEGENLPVLLPVLYEECFKNNWNIIFVDDGSTDNTWHILNQFNRDNYYKIIRHRVNKGYGEALIKGIENAETKYVITFDGDNQHYTENIDQLFKEIIDTDADLIIGSRKGFKHNSKYRQFGKFLIRQFAKLLMKVNIYDINSGLKIYNTDLVKKYIKICPPSMAFSDIITLIFISQKHLVLEKKVDIRERKRGKSTINIFTAFNTLYEIINIIILFSPMKIFLFVSLFTLILTTIWAIPFILQNKGITTGTALGYISALIFFLLGLLAEQLSQIRKDKIK